MIWSLSCLCYSRYLKRSSKLLQTRSVHLTCEPGYQLSTELKTARYRCQNDGTWIDLVRCLGQFSSISTSFDPHSSFHKCRGLTEFKVQRVPIPAIYCPAVIVLNYVPNLLSCSDCSGQRRCQYDERELFNAGSSHV